MVQKIHGFPGQVAPRIYGSQQAHGPLKIPSVFTYEGQRP